MKRYILIFLFSTVSLIVFFGARAKGEFTYWEKIKNIPAPYNNSSQLWLDIFFLPADPDFGWVCGYNGYVIRTTDRGNTWNGVKLPFPAGHLESVHFPSRNIGYTSGGGVIFKTSDGGVSWTNITSPAMAALGDLWGCYFVDDNVGMVVGGGCGTGGQEFWRTTDGGANWTLFEGNELNSGMTDVLLYSANGLGYAVSSGLLWRTTNGGDTWVVQASSGSNDWQEEMTNIGNSFLFPVSGQNGICSGGGNVGSLRFTTDGGLNWQYFSTGASPMYGAFLTSTTSGWACGQHQKIYYTSDAGVNWTLKNCGITNEDLDDIFFINTQEGWVCGHGVFKLTTKPDVTVSANKSAVDFGKNCFPIQLLDTIEFTYHGGDVASFVVNLSQDIDFQVVEPASLSFDMPACMESSKKIIIKFNPKTTGLKTSVLNISGISKNININIQGNTEISNAKPSSKIITINPLIPNIIGFGSVFWTSNYDEQIDNIYKITSSSTINYAGDTLPIGILANSAGVETRFSALLDDIGWHEAEFVVYKEPCLSYDTITVRAFGISPVIMSLDSLPVTMQCKADTLLKLPISNIGNNVLNIESIILENTGTWASIEGWYSTRNVPLQIDVNKSDTLYIRIFQDSAGFFQGNLRIVNNDSTKARGNRNPLNIPIRLQINKTKIEPLLQSIDFGDICFGNSATKSVLIKNNGNMDAPMLPFEVSSNSFSVSGYKTMLKKLDSMNLAITFTPKRTGSFIDSLIIPSYFCGEKVIVLLKGRSYLSNLTLSPQIISLHLNTGTADKFSFDANVEGNKDAEITSITIVPSPPPGLVFDILQKTPFTIKHDSNVTIECNIESAIDTVYQFTLCLNTNTECVNNACLDIEISSRFKYITIDKKSIEMDSLLCLNDKSTASVTISNKASIRDTIETVNFVGSTNIKLLNMPDLPLYLMPDEDYTFNFEYSSNSTSQDSAWLNIKSIGNDGQQLVALIYGNASYPRFEPIYLEKRKSGVYICSSLDTSKYYLYNNGERQTTVHSSILTMPGLTTDCPDVFSISAKDSFLVQVFENPSLLKAGVNNLNIDFLAECSQISAIEYYTTLLEPDFVIQPLSVNFGKIWYETNAEKSIELVNKGNNFVLIDSIYFTDNTGGMFSYSLSNMRIDTGRSQILKVKFSADTLGSAHGRIKIVFRTPCKDSVLIILNAEVPEEIYFANVRIPHYSANPGDTIWVSVLLDTAVSPKVEISKLDFEMNYDKFLFKPLRTVLTAGGQYENLNFENSFGKYQLKLDSLQSKGLLSKAGELLRINGLVLAAVPDSTTLELKRFEILSNRDLRIEKENGFLFLKDFCRPPVAIGFLLMADFTITNVYMNPNAELEMKIDSRGDQSAEIYLTNSIGETYKIDDIYMNNGEYIYKKQLKELSSGLVYIKIINKYGLFDSVKLILVK